MTAGTCPQGHPSTSADYCDVCGAPMGDVGSPGDVGGSGSAAAAAKACPNCQTENAGDALFCESCGYDFTTGAMPRKVTAPVPTPAPTPASAVPLQWVVEVWVDPDWYDEQDSDETCPSPGLPAVIPLPGRSALVGRASQSRNIHPEVDCSTDVGVSRRQAQLTSDGSRWWVEDLNSSNGTFVGSSSGPLPTQPLTPGARRELTEGDRVYVGAWTRLVVRRTTEQEQTGPA